MSNRYFPTLKEIVYNTLSVIHNHPAIKNPIVNYPLPNFNNVYEPVPIERYRSYDGLELIEPGLTLSIFPRYGSALSSAASPYGGSLASEFKPYTLGAKSQGSMYEATYYLTINLAYQDVALNNEKTIVYVKDKYNNISIDKEKLIDNSKDIFPNKYEFALEINPAEEILRDYLEVIRLILESIDYYAPWSIRSSVITGMGFPSTSWNKDTKQIYFHQAYMNWELSTYAPTNYDEHPITIRNLDISIKH
jgi:hypothetical protein